MSIGDVAACVYCVPRREVGRLCLPTSLLGTQYAHAATSPMDIITTF